MIYAGLFGAALIFDPFPYGLLTLIVSLEGILLSTFVVISQNRRAAPTDVRPELDFEANVRSGIWSVHIGRQPGPDPHEVQRRVHESVRASNQRVSAPIGSPTKTCSTRTPCDYLDGLEREGPAARRQAGPHASDSAAILPADSIIGLTLSTAPPPSHCSARILVS